MSLFQLNRLGNTVPKVLVLKMGVLEEACTGRSSNAGNRFRFELPTDEVRLNTAIWQAK